jgi:hypothetical protein
VDEYGLFFNLLPNRAFAFKGESCYGGKMSEHIITVLLCANMDGSDKMLVAEVREAKVPQASEVPTSMYRKKTAVHG